MDEHLTCSSLSLFISAFRPQYTLSHVCQSNKTAKQILNKQDIDLIIADLLLADGYCLSTIAEYFPSIPIIIISGDENEVMALSAQRNTQIVKYLMKPISRDMLEAAIESFENISATDYNIHPYNTLTI